MDLNLDDLLTEAMQERESRLKSVPDHKPSPHRKGGKRFIDPTKPANGSWMNAKEHEEYARQVKVAEAKGMWKNQRAVAMFSTQICLQCGSTHTHFEGFFLHQLHEKSLDIERWIKAPDTISMAGLPRTRKTTLHEADACSDCIDSQGFVDIDPSLTEPSYATWTPSKNRQVYSNELDTAGGLGRKIGTAPLE